MECFRLLFDNLAWIEHQFLSGIRDSRKAKSLRGMMRGMGGVKKSIPQSWLAKALGLGLLRWGVKGVQQDIPWEEASTLQIGSVAFSPGQYTSPQLHPCHRNVWNASDCFSTILHESSISFWVAYEIQGRQGVCEGWWVEWEE